MGKEAIATDTVVGGRQQRQITTSGLPASRFLFGNIAQTGKLVCWHYIGVGTAQLPFGLEGGCLVVASR